MIKFKAYSFILYGVITYLIVFIFGPYKFTIYDNYALIYCIIAFLNFILFAWLFDRPLFKSSNLKQDLSTHYEVIISKKAEKFLLAMMLLGFFSFLIYFRDLKSLQTLSEYTFGTEDYRDLLSVDRTIKSKISEIFLHIGVAVYLIVSRIKNTNFKITKVVSLCSFFIPAIAILAVGARSRVVTTIGLFIIITLLNRKENKHNNMAISIKKIPFFYKLVSIGIIVFLLYFTMNLFSTRGEYDATFQIIKYDGDTILKNWYMNLFNITNGRVNAFYKASWYYVHSIPAFTWSFSRFEDVQCYHGAFLFYLLGYILRPLGFDFPDFVTIANQSPISGLYSSFLTGYFLDWGIYGTLIAVILTGIVFGRVSYNSYRKKMAYFLLPIVLFMCWVAPIYYFPHMGWEYVLFCFSFVYPISCLLGLETKVIEKERIENE